MIDVTGDLWTYPAQVRAITTNGFLRLDGRCVMGRGCALEARTRYPGLDLRIGRLIDQHGNRCFRLPVSDTTLLTFPVKHRWDQPADLDLIAKSCREAMTMADKFLWTIIVVPRPGSGNGRLDYHEDVQPVIEDLLDDRFRVITW